MKTNSLIKKLVSAVLSAALAVTMMSMPVLASDVDADPSIGSGTRQYIGPLLAGGSGVITNGLGSVYVFLAPGSTDCDVKAGTSVGAAGTVDCYFTTPGGNTFALGTILANSDCTDYIEVGDLAAGTYIFTFEASTNDPIHVYARIYD